MSLWLYILAFLFIYNVPFTGIPISASKIAVVVFILCVLLKYAEGKKIKYNRVELHLLVIAIGLLLFSLMIMLVNGTNDTSIVYACVLLVVNHMFGSFLLVKICKEKGILTLENMMKLIIVLAVTQSVIIILMMVWEPFYDFFSNLAYLPTRDSIKARYNGARGYGLAMSITYELGVVQSFSAMFLAYFMQEKRKAYHVLAYLLIVVSILVTGRTALIGVILSIVYLLMTDSKAQKKGMRTFLILGLAGGLIVFCMVSFGDENSVIVSLEDYLFEAINNYKLTGKFGTSTGSNLVKMFESMKEYSVKTWLIGDGRYKGEGLLYYGHVDVGFLRHILYFGVIGCAVLLGFYGYIYYKGSKLVKNSRLKVMWNLLFIYIMLAHIKGDFLLGCSMGISIVLILFYTFVEERAT